MRLLLVFPALVCALCCADEITGVVVDESGKPAAGANVQLHVGRARYALTEEFDWWYAVETKTVKAGADGAFAFTDLPQGAVATLFVKTETGIGTAQGTGQLRIQLGPGGSIKGKVVGKRTDIKGLRIWVMGGFGLGNAEGTVDKKTGTYEVEGLTPGAGRVYVKRRNWDLARQDVEIAAGKRKKVKSVKLRGKYLPSPDPMVDCITAKLVDADGKPVSGVQLIWSSLHMDGGMNSNNDGIVKLAGGGVAIGGPPYRLRLKSLKGQRGAFEGTFQKIKKGIAIVELQPLNEIKGIVKRGNAPLDQYRLFVVGPRQTPRVYRPKREEGTFTIHLPAGKCRFVVGTVDGKTQEHLVEIKPGQRQIELTLN